MRICKCSVSLKFPIRNLFNTAALAKVDAQRPLFHPQCLRLKQADLSHLAQAPPNNTLYELLQLVSANKVASAEIAAIDMDILLAFIAAFNRAWQEMALSQSATPP